MFSGLPIHMVQILLRVCRAASHCLYWKWNHVPFRGGYRAPRYGPIQRHDDGSSTTTISGSQCSHAPICQFIPCSRPSKLGLTSNKISKQAIDILSLSAIFFM
ncbi:unnamed protein product [Spodoptera littoralis]|uniref:Secreted protein n=1 Tax=Spodoptera littoralis TaxID=7109 RepID=A0A9P0N7M7_SPOLI|nr:unnamed protein product [Spodoptera littoralis]CAH1644479.1 unnamed protein product [Spodoptera littoralis]